MPAYDYSGKVAIVTGGGSGIGRALANALVSRGSVVVVADIDEKAAETVSKELGSKAIAMTVDVAESEQVSKMVTQTVDTYGSLDLLFNNAGIGVGGPVEKLSLAHWTKSIDVNLLGVVHGIHAAYPIMLDQGQGHIVNTASLAGLLPGPLLTSYDTTKHAVVGLSISLRLEAASRGVRVSVVCPGVIETPLLDKRNIAGLPLTMAEVDIRQALAPFGAPYPASSLAVDVLAGVSKNRPIIVTPRRARVFWRAYRLAPAAFLRLSEMGVSRQASRMFTKGAEGG